MHRRLLARSGPGPGSSTTHRRRPGSLKVHSAEGKSSLGPCFSFTLPPIPSRTTDCVMARALGGAPVSAIFWPGPLGHRLGPHWLRVAGMLRDALYTRLLPQTPCMAQCRQARIDPISAKLASSRRPRLVRRPPKQQVDSHQSTYNVLTAQGVKGSNVPSLICDSITGMTRTLPWLRAR